MENKDFITWMIIYLIIIVIILIFNYYMSMYVYGDIKCMIAQCRIIK
jgi:hypothetical protein